MCLIKTANSCVASIVLLCGLKMGQLILEQLLNCCNLQAKILRENRCWFILIYRAVSCGSSADTSWATEMFLQGRQGFLGKGSVVCWLNTTKLSCGNLFLLINQSSVPRWVPRKISSSSLEDTYYRNLSGSLAVVSSYACKGPCPVVRGSLISDDCIFSLWI